MHLLHIHILSEHADGAGFRHEASITQLVNRADRKTCGEESIQGELVLPSQARTALDINNLERAGLDRARFHDLT
jgi:hypothetical protein